MEKTAILELIYQIDQEYAPGEDRAADWIRARAMKLLSLERRQHEETHFDGQRCAGSKHPSSNDASAYYATKYTNQ